MILFLRIALGEKVMLRVMPTRVLKNARSSILHCLCSALCGVHCASKTQSHLDRKPGMGCLGFCRRAELPGSPSNRSSRRSGLLLQLRSEPMPCASDQDWDTRCLKDRPYRRGCSVTEIPPGLNA